jgi:APA family basic amino acid/polyamine antiporter
MILGTGLFVSLGAATAVAGSGILIAMIIGGMICLATGISAAQVGVNYPVEGGAFIWNRQFGYPTVSFVAGCSYILEGILGLAIVALGFATYSAQIIPGLPIPLTASIALVVVAGLNILGISPASKVMIGIFFINVVFLGLYVGFALPSVQATNLTPVFGDGIVSVLGGASIFFWTWGGFQRTAIMANEIQEPRKTIPFAIVGGLTIVAIIFLIVAGSTIGVLGADAMGQNDIPLFDSAVKVIGVWGGSMILALAWLSFFGEMVGDLLATAKVEHAMGEAHELPHWLASANKRFKSPHTALLMLTIVGVALIYLVPLRQLMPVASAGTLVWYAATNFAALKVNRKQRLAWPIISWLGIAACLGLFFSLPLWSVAATAGFLAFLAGIRWLLIRTKIRPA